MRMRLRGGTRIANTGVKMNAPGHAPTSAQLTRLARSTALGEALRARGWSCATEESCTGGRIAHDITAIAGSSDYFVGGVVAYSNPVKADLLGVQQRTLDSVGAVSAECAAEMAAGVRRVLGVDVGVSSTGIAGPGGATARKPVGLVYIGVSTPLADAVREVRLSGDRLTVIDASIAAAMQLAVELTQDRRGAGTPEMEQ
jgi:PncC family amidohydrolase